MTKTCSNAHFSQSYFTVMCLYCMQRYVWKCIFLLFEWFFAKKNIFSKINGQYFYSEKNTYYYFILNWNGILLNLTLNLPLKILFLFLLYASLGSLNFITSIPFNGLVIVDAMLCFASQYHLGMNNNKL